MPQGSSSRPRERPNSSKFDLSEIDAALIAEIEADENERRLRPIELGRGLRRSPPEKAPSTYEFCCTDPLREGDRGVLALGDQQCQAVVTGRRFDTKGRPTVLLRLQTCLGDIAPCGTFTPESCSLQKLREHLFALPGGFNHELALQAIGGASLPTKVPPAPDVEWLSERLNEGQLRAVAQTFSHPVSIVWGPPGTGKTRTLVATAEAHLREGHTLLIAAPTHAALDRILEVAEPWLKTLEGYGEGAVLRLGQIRCPALAARMGAQVDLHQVQSRLMGERAEEISALTGELDRATLPEERDRLVARLGEVQARPALTEEVLMHRAKVILMTTHQSFLPPLAPRVGLPVTKSTVLVDEAGMVGLHLLFATAGLAQHHVALFGDFRQLPPVVKSGAPLSARWLGRTGFDAHDIPAAVGAESDPRHLTVLTEQHRMAPSICAFVSEASYANRLQTAPSLRRGRAPVPALPGGALHLLDTSRLLPTTGYRNGSRHNEVHAKLIAEVVRSLREPAEDELTTLVLTTFRAQMVALNGALRRAELPAIATTIHRAQGAETDVAVVDLVETDPRKISHFLTAQGPDDTGAQLLNVAVSRAKRAVVVVAAVEPLLRSPATGRYVKALLTKLQQEASPLDPMDYRRPEDPRAA